MPAAYLDNLVAPFTYIQYAFMPTVSIEDETAAQVFGIFPKLYAHFLESPGLLLRP